MIHQRPHDLLEIYLDGQYYYLVVLTKIVLFGGNIVFGFHGDGTKQDSEDLLLQQQPTGFNCCVDLLYAKKHGEVKRIAAITVPERYWLTKFAKSPIKLGDSGDRVWGWKIYSIHDLQKVKKLKFIVGKKYKQAMDNSCAGFGFYTQLVERKYLLGQSVFLNEN